MEELRSSIKKEEKKGIDLKVSVIKGTPREETKSLEKNQNKQEENKLQENSENSKIEPASGKRYISDVIGSDYQQWTLQDIILITAPTGSGKSHFILYVYLKWIIEQSNLTQDNLQILYLVNRKVLKKQLEEELNRDVEDELFDCLQDSGKILSDYITISTYQSIEKGLRDDTTGKTIQFLKKFYCVIYDEAHYFYSDSDFNTYTQLSFDCLRKEFDCKIQIFMSATMKNLEEYLKQHTPVYLPFDNTSRVCGDLYLRNGKSCFGLSERFIKYDVEKDYSYINVKIVKSIQGLVDMIQNSNDKWLIFVDSIPLGKEFRDSLIANNNVKKEDVVFIDAKYQKDYEASKDIEDLSTQQSIKRRIVIATAVLDNGVSFHDNGLRNIAIMADTEEEFIQMLGRKRDDGQKLNLYIFKSEIDYFSKRYESVKRKLNFYKKYKNDINRIYGFRDFCGNLIQIEPYTDLYHRVFPKLYKGLICYNYSQIINDGLRLEWQRKIMNDIVCQDSNDKYIRSMCYFTVGLIAFNDFSIKKCQNLKHFYGEMKKDLEEDDDAFIKRQFQWLKLSSDIECCVIQDYVDVLRKKIKDVLEPMLNRQLSTEYKNVFTGMSEKALEKQFIEKLQEKLGKE